MKPYASIETVFKRNPDSKLDVDAVRLPAVPYINLWTVSEKIDGMNIRVIFTLEGMQIKGRSDNAQIPSDLIISINDTFPHYTDVITYFEEYRGKALHQDWSVTFYGEGYGGSIQKGSRYSEKKKFRCFDLLLGEHLWTDDDEMRRICKDLGIPTAPWLGYYSFDGEHHDPDNGHWCMVPRGLEEMRTIIPFSRVAYQDRGVKDVEPEGIVAKPLVQLFDTHGNRLLWKLTFREFNRDKHS